MAKFGGFGGGMGNMQALMKQAQQMQQKMAEAQQQLEESEVKGSAGEGLVEITLSGKKQLLGVRIDPKAVDPDDVEMLEDLITAAYNDAAKQADELYEELMGPLAGMM